MDSREQSWWVTACYFGARGLYPVTTLPVVVIADKRWEGGGRIHQLCKGVGRLRARAWRPVQPLQTNAGGADYGDPEAVATRKGYFFDDISQGLDGIFGA